MRMVQVVSCGATTADMGTPNQHDNNNNSITRTPSHSCLVSREPCPLTEILAIKNVRENPEHLILDQD